MATKALSDMITSTRNSYKLETIIEVFDIVDVVKTSLDMLKGKLVKHGVEIDSRLLKNLCIRGCKSKFIQIILNLIDNAIDSGARKIIINAKIIDKKIHIYITDDGAGVLNANAEKIFQLFYSTKENGSGVGLYIARKFAREDFGGDLKIKDNVTSGTTFELIVNRLVDCDEI
jgi:signal transduction histidine kinase